MYSVYKKRHIIQFTDPLTSLLLLLNANSKDFKFLNSKISFCLRICIFTDMENVNQISYIPSYYSKEFGIRKAVLEDMKSHDIIIIDRNILFYKYKIINYKLYRDFESEIEDYLKTNEIIFRYDILVLCLIYLGKYEFVDNYKRKISSIIEKYESYKINEEESNPIQELIKKVKKLKL